MNCMVCELYFHKVVTPKKEQTCLRPLERVLPKNKGFCVFKEFFLPPSIISRAAPDEQS